MSHFDILIGAQRGLLLTTMPRRGGPERQREGFKQCMATRLAGVKGLGGKASHGLLDSGKWLDWLLRGQERVRLEMVESGLGGWPTAMGVVSVAVPLQDTHCRRGIERPRAQRDSSG